MCMHNNIVEEIHIYSTLGYNDFNSLVLPGRWCCTFISRVFPSFWAVWSAVAFKVQICSIYFSFFKQHGSHKTQNLMLISNLLKKLPKNHANGFCL
jgi:hypothetical protein